MDISGQLPPQLSTSTPLPSISSWKVGQVLQAIVLQQLSPANAVLQINNQRLQADTSVPLSVGQRFEAVVTQLGQKPVLSVRNTLVSETPVNAAIRQSLPLQTNISALLSNANWLINQQTMLAQLSPTVQNAIKQVLNKIPNRGQLNNSKGIKQAVNDSGVFLESKLSQSSRQSTSIISSDMKMLLVKLMAAMKQDPAINKISTNKIAPTSATQGSTARPTTAVPVPGIINTAPTQTTSAPTATQPLAMLLPPRRGAPPQAQARAAPTITNLQSAQLILNELIRQTEGAVARTQLHQLASIPAGDQAPSQMSFEIPVRNQEHIDLFHFSIEEEECNSKLQKQDKKKKTWSFTVAFDLDPLGPMYARLRFKDGKIETTFWAEDQATTLLVNTHMDELGSRYKKSGIEVSKLQCFHGTPPEPAPTNIPQIVLDVKA